jgi:hypothetical protein
VGLTIVINGSDQGYRRGKAAHCQFELTRQINRRDGLLILNAHSIDPLFYCDSQAQVSIINNRLHFSIRIYKIDLSVIPKDEPNNKHI